VNEEDPERDRRRRRRKVYSKLIVKLSRAVVSGSARKHRSGVRATIPAVQEEAGLSKANTMN